MDASSNLMRPEISSVNAPVMNNGVNISDNYSRAPWSQDIINHNRQNTIDHNGLSDKVLFYSFFSIHQLIILSNN